MRFAGGEGRKDDIEATAVPKWAKLCLLSDVCGAAYLYAVAVIQGYDRKE
jgi:hypothetical protein